MCIIELMNIKIKVDFTSAIEFKIKVLKSFIKSIDILACSGIIKTRGYESNQNRINRGYKAYKKLY